MHIAFLEIEDWEKPFIEKSLSNHEIYFSHEHLTTDNISSVKDVEVLVVFINSQLNQEIISQLPNLKLIVTRSVGVDHIDLKYCAQKGIHVSNIPDYGVNTVAEHTFSLILALSRNLIPSIEQTRKGDFSIEGLRGFDLHGKTLGLVGFGNIARAVIKIAKGFGMKIVVYTRHPSEELARKIGVTFLDLKELLSVADVLSIHVPHTKETHHLINKRNITKCKKGSILVNTARGAVIETEAILVGLEKEIFRGVGLDVLEEECMIKEEGELLTKKFLQTCDIKTQLLNHVLLTKPNVIVTPHNAFNSTEALDKILHTTVNNVKSFIDGNPQNLVAS
jgi:D-lactate dehydrogenase